MPSASALGIELAVPPLETAPVVLDWTSGAHAVPAGAGLVQIRKSSVPVSPPTVASSNDARSCGIAFVSVASAGLNRVGVDGPTVSIDQLYDACGRSAIVAVLFVEFSQTAAAVIAGALSQT